MKIFTLKIVEMDKISQNLFWVFFLSKDEKK